MPEKEAAECTDKQNYRDAVFMFPNTAMPKLFVRNERDGWDCWENEV